MPLDEYKVADEEDEHSATLLDFANRIGRTRFAALSGLFEFALIFLLLLFFVSEQVGEKNQQE